MSSAAATTVSAWLRTTCGSAAAAPSVSSPAASDRIVTSSSAGRSTACDSATTAVNTDALTSCTASWEAMTTAVVWIGSILLCRTSITALSPASTCGQRIDGEHHDDVEIVALQRGTRRGLVGRVPARVDEALEHVVVLGDRLLVERVRRADEHRPQAQALAAIAGAEEHEERKRAEDEEQDQPGLAHDLGELLAHEGRALDDCRPGPSDPQIPRPHRWPLATSDVGRGRTLSTRAFDDPHERLVVVDDVLLQLHDREIVPTQGRADLAERAVSVADHDPPAARRHLLGRANDDLERRDRGQLWRIHATGELDVDDLTVERRPAQVVRGVDHEQLTVGEQPDEIAV